jgi:ATPase subunit of ABC transporter with duplicated ATPase domains
MAVLIQCHRITHSVGTKNLFHNLDLTISSGDRIGLVGHNGSGKSTLLSLLSGAELADDGELSRNSTLQLETVEQFINPGLLRKSLFEALAEKLPADQRVASHYRADQMLASMDFTECEYNYAVQDLSGGQQNRLMFARAMINDPNLVLFDEPTNHLDLKTLLLFENLLQEMRAAFLVISHDRQFLDSVTTRTAILRDEKLYYFELPFSRAKEALDEHDQAARASREAEEKNIRRLESSARRIATWSRAHESEKLARKAKSMEKRVKRLQQERTFVTKGSGLNLTIDVGSARADRMLHIENYAINAPGDGAALFTIKGLMIRPGERVALLGHNGVGKTTLINRIMHSYRVENSDPAIKFNPQCKIGYYDQELQLLDPSMGMLQILRDRCGGADNTLMSALIKAGFPYRDLDKHVDVLSGGEKARLMFLIIKLNQPNFLILDEPTNHIDIQGRQELEEQILDSNATILITSHDRRFVDIIAQRYLLIENGLLGEINDPDNFYSRVSSIVDNRGDASDDVSAIQDHSTEDDVLVRIVELERLLEADLARKPKFQKPKMQVAWRNELDHLYELL